MDIGYSFFIKLRTKKLGESTHIPAPITIIIERRSIILFKKSKKGIRGFFV